MKRVLALMLVVFGAVAMAGSALAAKPFRERTLNTAFTLNASFCGFEIAVEPTTQPLGFTEFVFSDGRFAISGAFVGTATNVATGESIDVNLSGHNTFVEHADGTSTLTASGGTILVVEGRVIIARGDATIEFDENGNRVSRTIRGSTIDVCAALG